MDAKNRVSIPDAIEKSGIKKGFLAKQLGISRQYLNKYLSRPDEISVKNAIVIANLTGYSLDSLDFGTSESSKFFKL